MDATRVGLWIQVATVTSVILGIGLVVWELRQQREFAETQHVTDNSSWYSASVQSAMGDNPAASIAVACDNPDEMSTADMVVLMSYYQDILYRVRNQYALQAVTSLKTFGWKEAADGNLPIIFATEFGLWWWENGTTAEPEIQEYGDQIRENLPATFSCASYFASYKERHEE